MECEERERECEDIRQVLEELEKEIMEEEKLIEGLDLELAEVTGYVKIEGDLERSYFEKTI